MQIDIDSSHLFFVQVSDYHIVMQHGSWRLICVPVGHFVSQTRNEIAAKNRDMHDTQRREQEGTGESKKTNYIRGKGRCKNLEKQHQYN